LLRFEDRWVWDLWVADDGERFHLFYLQAPRSPHNPDLRHFHVSIGHAVSHDLTTWEVLGTALQPSRQPRWDDYTTWTGSIVRAPDGRWLMFYTGTSRAEQGLVQRIGAAESTDLTAWRRVDAPALEADARWYERLDRTAWPDEAWRDPYVVADPHGDGWHMLITARSTNGPPDRRGVIGHARSSDLTSWEVQPPLTDPGSFGHLEVPQVVDMDGDHRLLFSCHVAQMPEERRPGVGTRGVWCVPGPGLLGPYDTARATAFDHPNLYAARLVRDRAGRWNLLGFLYNDGTTFVGTITDPIPVTTTPTGLTWATGPRAVPDP
jgi:beta-fructofuranosidase